jgi:hypothetical protein
MKHFGRMAAFACIAVVVYSGSRAAEHNKETAALKVLTMPKSVAVDSARDSRLVIFDPKTKRTENFVVSGDVSVATVPSPESVLLEIESRDEESFAPSVWNAWRLSETIESLAKNFDFRGYFKGSLRMSGIPEQVRFMSFFKIAEDGIVEWVVVHQAVTNGELEDDVFAAGNWICVPSQVAGHPEAIIQARLVRIVEAANECRYEQLPIAPQLIQEQLAKALKSQPFCQGKGSEDDPFFSQPLREDPFESQD